MGDWVIIPDFNVHEHVTKETGLVSKDGYKIVRNPEPIGFTPPKSYAKYGVQNG